MIKIITTLLIFYTLPALAEYRVYQYLVKNTAFKAQDQNAYISTSTLDPISYKAYKSGSQNVKVDLMRTWSCQGYTGMSQDYCPSPYEKTKEAIQ
ncbi:MAG: hypothetical protein ACOYL6_07780 [Bacteriovoracaceae bacterium]